MTVKHVKCYKVLLVHKTITLTPYIIEKEHGSNRESQRKGFEVHPQRQKCILHGIRLPSMETRRIQDVLLTINNGISDKAPFAIRDLITLCSTKYKLKLRHDYILSLPKVNTTKYGLKSWRYFADMEIWNELTNDTRIKAGTNELKNKIRSLKL